MYIPSILKKLAFKLKTSNKKQRVFNTSGSSFISDSSQNSSTLSDALDISEYLEYEWFDLEPKTDYTYSRSVSYNNVKGDKIYISPNMSRRRLHGDASLLESQESPKKMIPTSTHWLRSREKVTDFSTPQHSENSFSSYLTENIHNEHVENNQGSALQTSNSVINRRRSSNNSKHESSNTKTVTTITNTVTEFYEDSEGQIEKGMKEANTSKAIKENQALSSSSSSSAAATASREFTKETVTTEYLIKDKSADIYDNDKALLYSKDSNLGSHYRQQSTSSYKSNAAHYNKNESAGSTSEKSSGYNTQSGNTSQKRFLAQKMASAVAALSLPGSYFKRDKSTTVKHMYGLDSDTDDYDDVCGRSTTAKASASSGIYSMSSPYYAGTKHATARTASRDGLVLATAKGAKRLCTKTVTTVIEFVDWLTFGTTRKVASVVTSRRLCCCCLPLLLLLLLPLLLSGLWAIAELSAKNSTTIINQLTMLPFIRKPEVIMIERGGASTSQLLLEKQVQMLILQMQETREKQNEQLSRADVEAMIKSMSAEQLATFMGHVNQNGLKQNEQLEGWKQEQLAHFETVNEKMKLLITKAETLNAELIAAKKSLESQSSASGENKNKIALLEESLHTLVGEFSHLKNFQHEYYNLFKNCCKNATAIRSDIKEEVYAALLKVLGGNTGGDSGTAESVVQQTLTAWLHDNYISRSELDSQLSVLAKTLTKKLQDMLLKEKPNATLYLSGVNSGISESFVRALVDDALVKFSADKTGMADFALESGGGSVISTRCSETYTKKTALVSIFGIPLFYKSNSPRTAIQPDVNPGECWAFKGSIGTLVIQLSRKIKITAISMEHIPKSISPHGRIDSAPKDFSVYSLSDLNDQKGVCLGNYTYEDNGRPLQQFSLQVENTAATQLVEVRISSNHGNLEFTCLYRFRVHGIPDDP